MKGLPPRYDDFIPHILIMAHNTYDNVHICGCGCVLHSVHMCEMTFVRAPLFNQDVDISGNITGGPYNHAQAQGQAQAHASKST